MDDKLFMCVHDSLGNERLLTAILSNRQWNEFLYYLPTFTYY